MKTIIFSGNKTHVIKQFNEWFKKMKAQGIVVKNILYSTCPTCQSNNVEYSICVIYTDEAFIKGDFINY